MTRNIDIITAAVALVVKAPPWPAWSLEKGPQDIRSRCCLSRIGTEQKKYFQSTLVSKRFYSLIHPYTTLSFCIAPHANPPRRR